jgi:formylglycine-generating enzyme required for sulfatase activity
VNDTGYKTDAEKDGKGGSGFDENKFIGDKPEYTWRNPGFTQGKNHPVVNVSWNDAVAFCKWLEKKEGRKFQFQLPTDAQWEYACRAGTTTRYYCGDHGDALKDYANIADASFKAKLKEPFNKIVTMDWDDGYPFTAPVGKFKPNNFGLYDMHGNVWQWCLDGPRKYDNKDVIDPIGHEKGGRRRERGGAWNQMPFHCRAANRTSGAPAHRGCNLGFRVSAVPLAPTP